MRNPVQCGQNQGQEVFRLGHPGARVAQDPDLVLTKTDQEVGVHTGNSAAVPADHAPGPILGADLVRLFLSVHGIGHCHLGEAAGQNHDLQEGRSQGHPVMVLAPGLGPRVVANTDPQTEGDPDLQLADIDPQ